jgi:hypothetical protein
VRIFSDPAYIPPGVEPIWQLAPFWGSRELEKHSVQPKRLERYIQTSSSVIQLTSLQNSDVAMFPAEYQLCDNEERRPFFVRFAQLAAKAGKSVIVFTGGDLEHPLPAFQGYEFHTSLYSSSKPENSFAMPTSIGDIVEEELGGTFPLLSKEPAPSVGFCGFAPPLSSPFNKEMLKECARDFMYSAGFLSRTRVGYAPRAKAIRVLKKSKALRTDFVLRDYSSFTWAFGYLLKGRSLHHAWNPPTGDGVAEQRQEYLRNLLASPYTLCIRGRGNYSLRFYEALCCGRIPVFVNTDSVLPFEDRIHWKDYCVWVEESDIPHIATIVADFHARISASAFRDLQVACRELWLKHLSPEGFMRTLAVVVCGKSKANALSNAPGEVANVAVRA